MDAPVANWTVTLDANAEPLKRELAESARLGSQLGRSLATAFEGIAIRGRGVSEVLSGLALSLSRIVLNAAFKPLGNMLGNIVGGLLGGGGGFAFAQGGVIQRGMPVPFASGGVVSAPTTFPLAGGRVGLMGERGPEAIMPLARGSDGRLGVRAEAQRPLAITFNVTATDAESFRRSEAQLAAMLARAVGHGQRAL